MCFCGATYLNRNHAYPIWSLPNTLTHVCCVGSQLLLSAPGTTPQASPSGKLGNGLIFSKCNHFGLLFIQFHIILTGYKYRDLYPSVFFFTFHDVQVAVLSMIQS